MAYSDNDSDDYDYGEDLELDEEVSDDDNSPTVTSGRQDIKVYGSDRKTRNVMTKYEYSRLISSMAKLYEENFPVHPKLLEIVKEKGIFDPLDLAEIHMETDEVPFPLDIQRPIQGKMEVWNARELIRPTKIHSAQHSIEEE